MFVSISKVIGCEDRLRNDLYCVEWGVKLYSNQHVDPPRILPQSNCHRRRISSRRCRVDTLSRNNTPLSVVINLTFVGTASIVCAQQALCNGPVSVRLSGCLTRRSTAAAAASQFAAERRRLQNIQIIVLQDPVLSFPA